jgi:alkaline phosphatase D
VLADNVKITLVEVEVEDSSPTSNSTAALDRNLNKTTGSTHIEEEIDVEETVLLERKTPKILRTLLTGLPSPTSTLLSLLTFLMNVLLVLAVTDLVYTAKFYHASEDLSFARIGYVSDKEAKLLIREPDKSKLPITVHLRIHDPKPP